MVWDKAGCQPDFQSVPTLGLKSVQEQSPSLFLALTLTSSTTAHIWRSLYGSSPFKESTNFHFPFLTSLCPPTTPSYVTTNDVCCQLDKLSFSCPVVLKHGSMCLCTLGHALHPFTQHIQGYDCRDQTQGQALEIL